jgi:predicted membrane protein
VNDLPAKPSSGALSERYEHAETVYSVLGSTARRGPWKPPETMRTVSVLGSTVLDYRDADLPLGVTEVDCQVFLGSVEIVVPSNVDVELTGSVFLGSVETKSGKGPHNWLRRARERLVGQETEPEEGYERPLLSVDCSGVMGSVEVKLR